MRKTVVFLRLRGIYHSLPKNAKAHPVGKSYAINVKAENLDFSVLSVYDYIRLQFDKLEFVVRIGVEKC